MDENHVYWISNRLEGADPKSFKVKSEDEAVDKYGKFHDYTRV